MINTEVLQDVVRRALEEDLGSGDVTSELTLDPQSESEGIILAREEGVLAGMPAAEQVFLQVEPRVVVTSMIGEGEPFKSGEIIAQIAGPTAGILAGERVALNFLQGLCGIATRTSQFVDAVKGTDAVIHGRGSQSPYGALRRSSYKGEPRSLCRWCE
jgi:nicotinate-nucleotide pyrophosphorylase (carboxylating)